MWGDEPGIDGTTHDLAADRLTGTGFTSSHDNWQHIEFDFGCVGRFHALERLMTKDGSTTGARVFQGESVKYSVDRSEWIEVRSSMASGWEAFVNYGPNGRAWHTVDYGWTPRLTLNTAPEARYVRFEWDGANDTVNEVLIDMRANP